MSIDSASLDSEISGENMIGAVGGVPLAPVAIDYSGVNDADSASLASIESGSDDADMTEDDDDSVDAVGGVPLDPDTTIEQDGAVGIVTGPITQEHINQARLCNVIVTVCADVLRDILLSQVQIPYSNIYSTLLGNRATIAAMRQIGQEQFMLIFPDPHFRYTGTVDQFDITLLYALIRNISSCPAPVTSWGRPPTDHPRDTSLSANVERVRFIRNNVSGHSVDGKLDDQACEDYFGEIGEILDDVEAVLGDKGYKDALEERRKQIITPQEAKALRGQFESYQQQLKGTCTLFSEHRREKPGFTTRSDTNRAVQPLKMDRGLKFWIHEEEGLNYQCSDNKGADQLRGYHKADLRLCFRICKKLVFSCRGSNFEPCHEKTCFLYMQKMRHRSAVR